MMNKYRVHEVAKDLDVPTQAVLDVLTTITPEPKKNMTALEENELNFVFDSITKNNSVDSLDAYFAQGDAARAAKAEAKKAEKLEKLAAQEQLARQLKENMAKDIAKGVANDAAKSVVPPEAKAPAPQKQLLNASGQPVNRPTPGQATTRAPKPAPRPSQATIFNKSAQAGAQNAAPKAPAAVPRPAAPKQAGVSVQPNRGPVEVRHIDNSKAVVELDRYNEKYEKIAPARTYSDNIQKKQKLNQKSKNRKPFFAKRDTEADKLRRIQLERIKKIPITVIIPEEIVVSELALRMKKTAAEVVKQLIKQGFMVTLNDTIDYDTAALIAMEMGCKVEHEVVVTIEERIIDDTADDETNLQERSPVVVVMGHVDHGKTSILDAIRNSEVTAGEAGGITQHIGAYRVSINDREITFLDTPGHAAFTAMRQRGAEVTDIAVLVVAADDGIMPQTIEAINHAKAAGVQIIVAINKMDKEGANPDRIMQQLTEHEIVPDAWGGDVMCIPVSAVTRQGIDTLLESIILVADVAELKANPDRKARGAVIEARLDKGRGPIATMLVQTGTLRQGDIIVAGSAVGRVRAMTDDRGNAVTEAGPSMPVEITGLAEVPAAGDSFDAVSDEKLARELVEQRKHDAKNEQWSAQTKVTLDNLFTQMQEGEVKDLNIIIKADVQGSVEAIRQSLVKIGTEEVRVRIIHGGVGAVSESDVMLANSANAIIVGFNVRPDPIATASAARDGVDMRLYRVIYDCIEEIEAAMKGMLAPKFREVMLGRIEVRSVFKITNVGTIAGCYVLDGKVTRAAEIRVVRDGIVIVEDKIDSLKRFKDDAKEVAQGYECGIGLDKFNDVKEGDIFEAFLIEEYRDE